MTMTTCTSITPPGQPVPPPYEKSIAYDYETRDYAMYLDTGNGPELIGFARTHHEGETTLDQLVFELLNGARETTDTPDPEDNHRRGDCGAALNEFGQCEDCIDRRARERSCPSCDAPTHAPGICAACRAEATERLHAEELTFSQYVALAVAGAG
jgi:hypothetical protein